MKTCPQCHSQYADTIKFCHRDGSLLVTTATGTRNVGGNASSCPQCGTGIQAGKRFCHRCEAKRETFEPIPNVSSQPVFSPPVQFHKPVYDAEYLLAKEQYAKEEYTEAIATFEQLLTKKPDSRLYQLYWLLAHIKANGISGYENGITEIAEWSSFSPEERPLASELFVLLGREYLQQGELALAEQRLLRAQQMTPSPEVTMLRAQVKEQEGDAAHRANDLAHALQYYQQAVKYDPTNQGYARKVKRVADLRAEERAQKLRALGRKAAIGIGIGVGALVFFQVGLWGYHKTREWYASRQAQPITTDVTAASPPVQPPVSSSSADPVQPTTTETAEMPTTTPSPSSPTAQETTIVTAEIPPEPPTVPSPQTTPETTADRQPPEVVATPSEQFGDTEVPVLQPKPTREEKLLTIDRDARRVATATEPPQEFANKGRVVTAKELDIQITGKGKNNTSRSPEALQQQVESHFAELQDAYEAERAVDPTVMGSGLLNLTITRRGTVSDVRFQLAKVTNQQLLDTVVKRARTWRFSPATGEVTVSYPLLFLPPGMDATSIIAWEKRTAALDVNRQPARDERSNQQNTEPESEPRSLARETSEPQRQRVRLGVYRVINRTVLKSEPRSNASRITTLEPGILVRVFGANGEYLEVRSRKGNTPGYVRRDDIVFANLE